MNEKLAHAGIDPNFIDGLQDVFTELSDPFKELDTEYLQEKYFKEELGIVVTVPCRNQILFLCVFRSHLCV